MQFFATSSILLHPISISCRWLGPGRLRQEYVREKMDRLRVEWSGTLEDGAAASPDHGTRGGTEGWNDWE